MSKVAERQRFIRYWKDETGETEVDMRKVAELAMGRGWLAPPPVDPIDRLAKLFKEAARQDVRHDRATGRPYRGYHAVPRQAPDGQLTFSYIDIDDPNTKPESFRKSAVMRREQMVDDGVQLSLDLDHWNSQRAEEHHVHLPFDLQPDIDWRRATLDDKPDAA